MKTEKSGSNARYDWNGDGKVNRDDLTFHIHELAGAGTSAHALLGFQKAGGELTAEDLIEFAKGGNNVGGSDLERFKEQGGTFSGKDVVALAEAGARLDQEDIVRLETRGVVDFSEEDMAALAALGIKPPGQKEVADFIADAKEKDSAEGLIELEKKSGKVTGQDLLAFQKKGGVVDADDLTTFTRAGGKLEAKDVLALIDGGTKLTGDDLVTLQRAGTSFTADDLGKFTKGGGTLSERNTRSFEKLGVESVGTAVIPEGTTCKKIFEMLDAGVKIDLKDIMAYLDANPEVGNEVFLATAPIPILGKFKWGGDFDYGKVVEGLVDKGARIKKEDVFALQEQRRCFSGWNLATFCEDNGLRLKADDLVRLNQDYACGDFNKKTIERIQDACHFRLNPNQYLTITD